jgi:hypothetical protein
MPAARKPNKRYGAICPRTTHEEYRNFDKYAMSLFSDLYLLFLDS